jgi:hypothetical protein
MEESEEGKGRVKISFTTQQKPEITQSGLMVTSRQNTRQKMPYAY